MLNSRNTKYINVNLVDHHATCPACGNRHCGRHSEGTRRLRSASSRCKTIMIVYYSKHQCKKCNYIFSNPRMNRIAFEKSRFTLSVVRMVIQELIKDNRKSYRDLEAYFHKCKHVKIPIPTMSSWLHHYENNAKFKKTIGEV